MKVFTSSFIAAKNQLEGDNVWAHLVELTVNVNTTARFTSCPETLTWNGNTYMPVPLFIGDEQMSGDGELPRLQMTVANFAGLTYKFAKDNDLSLQNTTIRFINTTLTASGNADSITMQILGSIFTGEIAVINLGWNFNYDAMGPRRIYDRTSYPTIPYNLKAFGVI